MWANLAQVAAVIGALIYFGYRLAIGYLIVNVSLGLDLGRTVGTEGRDHLTVTVRIRKGEHGALVLHDIAGDISWPGGRTAIRLHGFTRVSYTVTADRAHVNLDRASESSPLLTFPPGDETVSTFANVPSGRPCTVQVVILGKIMGARGTRNGAHQPYRSRSHP